MTRCQGYHCKCIDYRYKAKHGLYETCECSHAKQTHIETNSDTQELHHRFTTQDQTTKGAEEEIIQAITDDSAVRDMSLRITQARHRLLKSFPKR